MYIHNSPSFVTHTHHYSKAKTKGNKNLHKKKKKAFMELKSREGEEEKPVSVLQGDGICINKILARESSVGQSSRVFYRSNEGVPFRWEMQPGTPKNNPHEDDDIIPPICPSPLMQSLGLPLPNLDRDDAVAPPLKTSKFSRLKEMVKKRLNIRKVDALGGRSKHQESSRFCSICDDGPYCCSPCYIPAILDEGNTTIYYCSQHKNAFAVEEDDSFLSRILSEVSAAEQFSGPMQIEDSPAGIPFGWEMQPGTPKAAAEDERIPPPSPPPAVQSLSLPRPPAGRDNKGKNSTWKKAWFWVKRRGRKKEIIGKKMQQEMSFRYSGKMDFDASLRKTASVSSSSSISPLSKGGWKVSRIRRNLAGSLLGCGAGASTTRDMLFFARTKWKSFAS